MKDTIGEVEVLARSAIRARLLEELFEHERVRKDALKERVDASRTSIQRNLDVLEEHGWVASNSRDYWITQSGRPVVEEFLALLKIIHAAKRLQPLLEWLPREEFDLELHALAAADLTVARERNPYAPVNRHVDLLESADRFRCLLPAVGLQPMRVARDSVVERGSVHTVVFDPDVVATLERDRNYGDPVENLLEDPGAELLVSDRPVPFYLGLGDGVVQIGVGDDQGAPRSLVESDADEVIAWAEQKFDEFAAAATPLASHWGSRSIPER